MSFQGLARRPMSASGPLGHVLKIRPPLPFSKSDGDDAAISSVRYSESIHNERAVHPLRLVGGDGTISGISL